MKTTFQIASDLHLEFYPKNMIFDHLLTVAAPILMIPGDIGKPSNDNLCRFFQHFSPKYEKIFYTSGNHEYYNSFSSAVPMNIIEEDIKKICSEFPNVHYLNNQDHLLNEKLVILGTPLWTEIPPEYARKIKQSLNDYRLIYTQMHDALTPTDVTNMFKANVKWLESKLVEHKDKDIIVMTHHLPSFEMIHPQYQGNSINYGFASDLDYLMMNNPNIKYWVAGHTHSSIDITINQTRCIVNPAGYPEGKNSFENQQYDKEKIIFV